MNIWKGAGPIRHNEYPYAGEKTGRTAQRLPGLQASLPHFALISKHAFLQSYPLAPLSPRINFCGQEVPFFFSLTG